MITELFHALVFPGFLAAFLIGFLYMGILRKISAHMHHRIGPPVWQPFIDFVKLMSKEDIRPRDSFGSLMTLSPIVIFAAMMTVLLFIPVGRFFMLSFEGSMFVVIYFLIMAGIFFAFAGRASGSPFGSVGSIREITQIFAIELPFIISLLTVGYLNAFDIKPFLALQFPFAFFAFLVSLQGKLALPPFHIQEAESEIVAGPMTEFSGPSLAMLELGKSVSVWVLISLGAVMFMGANSLLTFAVSSLILLFLVVVIRNVFGRLKIDQSFRLLWFVIGPLALIDLLRVILGLYS